MFDRFKQKTIVIEKKFEIPEHLVQAIEASEDGGTAKNLFIEYLKTLDRVDFLRAGDAYRKIWDKDHEMIDWLEEAYNDVEWHLEFPMTKRLYATMESQALEVIPMWYDRGSGKGTSKGPILDLNKLVRQVEGVQKKLDKVEVLIANAEFKLCGKDALKL